MLYSWGGCSLCQVCFTLCWVSSRVFFLKDVLYILVLGVLFGRAFSLSGVLHILAVGFLLRGAERFPEHRAVDLGPDIF